MLAHCQLVRRFQAAVRHNTAACRSEGLQGLLIMQVLSAGTAAVKVGSLRGFMRIRQRRGRIAGTGQVDYIYKNNHTFWLLPSLR